MRLVGGARTAGDAATMGEAAVLGTLLEQGVALGTAGLAVLLVPAANDPAQPSQEQAEESVLAAAARAGHTHCLEPILCAAQQRVNPPVTLDLGEAMLTAVLTHSMANLR